MEPGNKATCSYRDNYIRHAWVVSFWLQLHSQGLHGVSQGLHGGRKKSITHFSVHSSLFSSVSLLPWNVYTLGSAGGIALNNRTGHIWPQHNIARLLLPTMFTVNTVVVSCTIIFNTLIFCRKRQILHLLSWITSLPTKGQEKQLQRQRFAINGTINYIERKYGRQAEMEL